MEEVAIRSLTRLPSEPEPGTPGKNWARRQWWELKRELGGRAIDKSSNRKSNDLAKVF